MYREEDEVQRIMQDIADGNEVGNKLVFDPISKTIKPVSSHHDPDRSLVITPKDMEHFSIPTRCAA